MSKTAKTGSGLLEDKAPSQRAAYWFFFAVVIGVVYLLASKWMGWSQLKVTSGPLIVMLIYAALMLKGKFSLRDDHSGDNLYYLGFIYTLTSLGMSLYQFSMSDGQSDIVTNFGIALSSTILGVTLRVMFNQMRVDPAEVERTARMELADTARRLRRELDDTVVDLNQFRRSAVQSSQDGYDTVRSMTQEMLTQIVRQVEDFSQKNSELISSLTDEFSGSSKAITSEMSGLAKSLSDLGKKLDAVKSPETLVRIDLEPALGSLSQAVDRIAVSQTNYQTWMQDLLITNDATLRKANDLLNATSQIVRQMETTMQRGGIGGGYYGPDRGPGTSGLPVNVVTSAPPPRPPIGPAAFRPGMVHGTPNRDQQGGDPATSPDQPEASDPRAARPMGSFFSRFSNRGQDQ